MPVEPGLTADLEIIVQTTDTARYSGGESFPEVLSTPRMISYLERTAHQAILPHLAENQGSVGTVVNVRHLAATPAGMQVRFHARLLEVDGRRLRFLVEAYDAVEKIAEGEHERFIIDKGRFNERLASKQQSIDSSQAA